MCLVIYVYFSEVINFLLVNFKTLPSFLEVELLLKKIWCQCCNMTIWSMSDANNLERALSTIDW